MSCSRCGGDKPSERRSRRCKACDRDLWVAWYARKKAARPPKEAEPKICKCCGAAREAGRGTCDSCEYRRVRDWMAANPDKYRAQRKRSDARRASDPSENLHRRIRSAIRASLRGLKRGRTFDLLGYSLDELRDHLERQFLRGMGWHNMREWHVDHIRPLASFNLDGGVESQAFREAWALTNLRPLWATDNLKKGAKRLFLL